MRILSMFSRGRIFEDRILEIDCRFAKLDQNANKRSFRPNDCDVENVRQNQGSRCGVFGLAKIEYAEETKS